MVVITMKVPEKKPRHGGLRLSVFSVFAVMLAIPSYSGAAEWLITPRMSLRGTYSDNVRLQRDEIATGDFVTQVNPGILLMGTGRRFDLNVSYTMNNLFYAQTSEFTRTRHQLHATGTAELMENLLFVDGRASMFQQNAALFGPQAIDNVNAPGARTDVKLYSISPYLRHRYGDLASTELRYTRAIVSSDTTALRNSERDSFQASIDGGEAFKTLNWGLNYSNHMIHFDRSNRTVELERSVANLRYMITPQFGLTATGGYERNSFVSIRGSPSSPSWSAGFTWQPSARTSVIANAGQRFFGDTYYAQARHRTRLTAWDVSYVEDITTFNQQAGLGSSINTIGSLNQLMNPGVNPDIIQGNTQFLVGLGLPGDPLNFLSNGLFLQKRLQASVALHGARNTGMLRLFNLMRKAYTPDALDVDLVGAGNAALLRHTRQTGVDILWSYRLSKLTRANISGQFARIKFIATGRVDDRKILRLSLTRELRQAHPRVNGMVELRHHQRDSSEADADFRENAITAALNMSF